mgnify:CR=1 FL=1
MNNKRDSLGERMKQYEAVPKIRLIRRMPVIIRLDGKAFHTFTRGFAKPFDDVLMRTMNDTMKYLCENIQGCVIGYTQSDEISLVLVDYKTLKSDAWFDNNVQKMCSIAASMATQAFNRTFKKNVGDWMIKAGLRVTSDTFCKNLDFQPSEETLRLQKRYSSQFDSALFDARAFNLPKEEVMNYLCWRQQDATRNSIQAAGQAQFKHQQLMRKSCNEIQEMLFTERGINWNDYTTSCKRGTCCIKKPMTIEARDKSGNITGTCSRNKWVIDTEIPIFNYDPQYINAHVMGFPIENS